MVSFQNAPIELKFDKNDPDYDGVMAMREWGLHLWQKYVVETNHQFNKVYRLCVKFS